MSDILTPEEAQRLLRVEGFLRPITDEDAQAVLATIDALAEALRAADNLSKWRYTPKRDDYAAISRVAAWLEET